MSMFIVFDGEDYESGCYLNRCCWRAKVDVAYDDAKAAIEAGAVHLANYLGRDFGGGPRAIVVVRHRDGAVFHGECEVDFAPRVICSRVVEPPPDGPTGAQCAVASR